ncbi:MAG: nicotinate-nucleotide--dimethylbenzimidazole phosphoribosyltransferase [Actinomycetota bacterium]|nr:nicotinate-nucleotide--dimethylbenzimidazole phosphoribosyltransferase [Actinomycetota bacterium]
MTAADLERLAGVIDRPDETGRTAARQSLQRLAGTAGNLGRLEDLAVWLAGVDRASAPRPLATVRLVIFAGDHGIAAAGVSTSAPEDTAEDLRSILAGGAAVNVLAGLVGAELHVVDLAVDVDPAGLPEAVTRHKVRRGSGRIDHEDALTMAEAEQAFAAGMAIADAEVDSGADLLIAGDLGVSNTTAAAALVGVLTRSDASLVTGRGNGIDDATWMRKCAAVRDAMRRGRPVLGDQIQLLATVGGADLAALTGFLLQAAARRTPVLLDGVVPAACALVAQRIAFRSVDWMLAAQVSAEPAHRLALHRLSLEPVLDLGLGMGRGSAALLAVPLLRAAAALTEIAGAAPVPDPSA